MPFKNGEFQYTRGEAYAQISGDRYGQEHDDRMEEGVDLENGVRKYWADQLRKAPWQIGDVPIDPDALEAIAALLDPYSGQDGLHGEFARTTLDDRDEGCKWIIPNAES